MSFDEHPDDERPGRLQGPAATLYDAVAAVVEVWLVRLVHDTTRRALGDVPSSVTVAASRMAASTAPATLRRLHRLLATDVDEQRTNPLSVLRAAVDGPTGVLHEAGVPIGRRDEFERRVLPDDDYGLSPATWRDVDESLHEPGLVWGAWKAGTVLQRRRDEGRR